MAERKKKAVERLEDQLTKLEIQLTDKDENKDIALGTSKLNYLDPRISVAWYNCLYISCCTRRQLIWLHVLENYLYVRVASSYHVHLINTSAGVRSGMFL